MYYYYLLCVKIIAYNVNNCNVTARRNKCYKENVHGMVNSKASRVIQDEYKIG